MSFIRNHQAPLTLTRLLGFVFTLTLLLSAPLSAFAQDAATPVTDDNSQPAPPSIGADIPLTYFGPAPSTFDPELVGPHQLLRAGMLDTTAGTITLPLYQGQLTDGRAVWYILTDTNDRGNADALGLNYSAKLTYAAVGKAARTATLEKDTTLTFAAGAVDFSRKRPSSRGMVTAPSRRRPRPQDPLADADYSPIVAVTNAGGFIYNAPIVAFDVSADQLNAFCEGDPDYTLVHDKVLSICPDEQTVTLALTPASASPSRCSTSAPSPRMRPSPRSRAPRSLRRCVISRLAMTTVPSAPLNGSSSPSTAQLVLVTRNARA